MRKRIVLAILLLSTASLVTTNAQLRHVQGVSLIGISCGIVPGADGSTHIIGLNYSKYLQKKWILNLSGLYDSGTIQSINVKNYLFNGGVDYTTIQYGDFIYFNVGLSMLAGLESLRALETSEKKNSFVSGPSGNANIELYFTDRIVMQVKAEQNYLTGSKLSNWYFACHVSLRYCVF